MKYKDRQLTVCTYIVRLLQEHRDTNCRSATPLYSTSFGGDVPGNNLKTDRDISMNSSRRKDRAATNGRNVAVGHDPQVRGIPTIEAQRRIETWRTGMTGSLLVAEHVSASPNQHK